MEIDDSSEPETLGFLSVEGCTLLGGVMPNADGVDVPNPPPPGGVERFGLGVKVGAKGLSDFEGDISEPEVVLLVPPKGNPLAWGTCGNNASVCDGC